MRNERMNKQTLSIACLIPPSNFRTADDFTVGCAPSEIPTLIQLKPDFINGLSFRVPSDGLIYSYIRCTAELSAFLKDKSILLSGKTDSAIVDWEDKFNMSIEDNSDHTEFSFFVKSEEIRYLLENCCRVPSQCSK